MEIKESIDSKCIKIYNNCTKIISTVKTLEVYKYIRMEGGIG